LKIGSKLFALVVTSVVLVAVVATNLQHVYAQIDPGNFVLWRKTTHEFEKNVINTIKEGPQPHLRELLNAYSENVNRIFIGDPGIDQIRILVQGYTDGVTTIFDQQPPDPDKQVKDFRSLTHDFEKAVIGLQNPPEPD
jgi:hypothetical protein